MRQGLKIAVSLLIALLVFGAIAVVSFTGFFDKLETVFFQPRVVSVREAEAGDYASAVESYHIANVERFSTAAAEAFVVSAFRANQSQQDIFNRENYFGRLLEDFPSIEAVRILGPDGDKLHYSTVASDLSAAGPTQRKYQDLSKIDDTLPAEDLKVQSGSPPRLIIDAENGRFVYVVPVGTEAPLGSIAFYVARSGLSDALLNRPGLGFRALLLVERLGVVVNPPVRNEALIAESVASLWENGAAEPALETLTLRDGDDQEARYGLVSRQAGPFGFVGLLVPYSAFELQPLMKGVLLASVFLTVFLILFLVLNVRQDPLVVLAQRVKRFQLEVLEEFIDGKQRIDWQRWRRELVANRNELKTRFKRGVGRLPTDREVELDGLIDRGWDEIIGIIDARLGEVKAQPVDLRSIEQLLQRALEQGSISIAAERKASRPKALVEPAAPPGDLVVEEIGIDEVVEASPAATAARAGAQAGQEPAGRIEAVEELEDAEAVEEVAEAVEEVGEAEEVAEALEEAEPLEEAEAVEEVAEALEEAEPLEEAEAVEEVAAAEEAEELLEVAAGEEVAEAVEEVSEAEEVAEPLEEVEPLEEAEAAEETAQAAEDTLEAESVEEPEALEVLPALEGPEHVEAAEAPEPQPEAEGPEELEALEEAESLGEPEEIEEEAGLRLKDAVVLGMALEEIGEAEIAEQLRSMEPAPAATPLLPPQQEAASAAEPEEGLEELEGVREIKALPPLPQEVLEELPEVSEEDRKAKRQAPAAASAPAPRAEEPTPAAGGLAEEPEELETLEEVGEAEELEVVSEAGEGKPTVREAAPSAATEKRQLEILLGSGKLEAYTLKEVEQKIIESRTSVVMENGVFRVKEELYAGGWARRPSRGLRARAESVLSAGEEVELESGIGSLFGEDILLDLDKDVGAASSGEVELLLGGRQKAKRIQFFDTGLDYDSYLKSFGTRKSVTQRLKSLVELSGKLRAVNAAVFSHKESRYSLTFKVGLLDDPVAIDFGGDEFFYDEFLSQRKAALVRERPEKLHALARKFNPDDLRYLQAAIFIPIMYENAEAYLYMGLPDEKQCDLSHVINRLDIY